MTPESQAFLEQYAAWSIEGHRELINLPVRKAEAFVVLEEETGKES